MDSILCGMLYSRRIERSFGIYGAVDGEMWRILMSVFARYIYARNWKELSENRWFGSSCTIVLKKCMSIRQLPFVIFATYIHIGFKTVQLSSCNDCCKRKKERKKERKKKKEICFERDTQQRGKGSTYKSQVEAKLHFH